MVNQNAREMLDWRREKRSSVLRCAVIRARSSMGMLSRGGDRCWNVGDIVGGVEMGIEVSIEGGPSWRGWRVDFVGIPGKAMHP